MFSIEFYCADRSVVGLRWSKYFNKPVYFERGLQVAGAINKLRLPGDLMVSKTNEFINTTVVFKEPVEFIGQLDLVGTYNDCTESVPQIIKINSNDLVSGPVVVDRLLTFNRTTLNGIDLRRL